MFALCFCQFVFALCLFIRVVLFICVMLFYLRYDFLFVVYVQFLALNSFLFLFGDVSFFAVAFSVFLCVGPFGPPYLDDDDVVSERMRLKCRF